MRTWIFESILKFKALRIRKKVLRNRYKRINMLRFYKNTIKTSSWGVSYSLFDGEELLEASLLNTRDYVDYINVVYQDISWYGEPSKQPLLPILKEFKKRGLIDNIILYKPDFKLSAGQNERKKRNIGLQDAKKHGVKYYMSKDVDEFYFSTELERAKYMIIKKNITRSIVKQDVYGLKPTQKMLYNQASFVPFFSKINFFSKHCKDKYLPALCDPNRQLNHQIFSRYYVLHQCSMHHMSSVRRDLESKFRNSSAPCIHKYGIPINTGSIYDKMSEVENCFNIFI